MKLLRVFLSLYTLCNSLSRDAAEPLRLALYKIWCVPSPTMSIEPACFVSVHLKVSAVDFMFVLNWFLLCLISKTQHVLKYFRTCW